LLGAFIQPFFLSAVFSALFARRGLINRQLINAA
jgi:hypothetical protein